MQTDSVAILIRESQKIGLRTWTEIVTQQLIGKKTFIFILTDSCISSYLFKYFTL